MDGDGDLDIVVAVLGSVWPTNDRVGQVVWLENRGHEGFVTHVILDDLRRVADVQAADLNGDGKPDLVVAEFGYDVGRVLWLENMGGGQFLDHELLVAPGPIHVPIADFDGDGKPDIVALVSQDYEEVWGFREPRRRQVPRSGCCKSNLNFDLGSAGLVADRPRPGRQAGPAAGWPATTWRSATRTRRPGTAASGCGTRGTGSSRRRGSRTLGGTYAAAVGDLNGDGDLDVVLVSMFNDWRRPGAASVVWLENDGKQNFTTWQIADRPTHLCTVAVGDLNGDGRADIVAGGFHILEPFDRIGPHHDVDQPEGGPMTRRDWVLVGRHRRRAGRRRDPVRPQAVACRPRRSADLSFVDARVAAAMRDVGRDVSDARRLGGARDDLQAYGYFPEAEACARHAAEHDPCSAERAYEWAFALERHRPARRRPTPSTSGRRRARPSAGRGVLVLRRPQLAAAGDAADDARRAFEQAGDARQRPLRARPPPVPGRRRGRGPGPRPSLDGRRSRRRSNRTSCGTRSTSCATGRRRPDRRG